MDNVVWMIIDAAAFVLYAVTGLMTLLHRHDLPTLDKSWAFPESDKTDYAPFHRFETGAGIVTIVVAVVLFGALPAVLWLTDVPSTIITGVVCGCAAIGAVVLFFADRFLLKAPSGERKR